MQVDPADTTASGTMLDKNVVSSTEASKTLTVLIAVNRFELARAIFQNVEGRILACQPFRAQVLAPGNAAPPKLLKRCVTTGLIQVPRDILVARGSFEPKQGVNSKPGEV